MLDLERQHRRRASRQPDERARRAQDGRARALRREEGTRPARMTRARLAVLLLTLVALWPRLPAAQDRSFASSISRNRPASRSLTTTALRQEYLPRRWDRARPSSTSTTTAARTCCWSTARAGPVSRSRTAAAGCSAIAATPCSRTSPRLRASASRCTDGCRRRRLRQRRLAGHPADGGRPESAVPEHGQEHVRRRHRQGRPGRP